MDESHEPAAERHLKLCLHPAWLSRTADWQALQYLCLVTQYHWQGLGSWMVSEAACPLPILPILTTICPFASQAEHWGAQ